MKKLTFEWDNSKAESNLKKHGVSFEEAKTIFDDDNARLILDPDHSNEEERFILLGMSYTLKVLTVVHCYRNNEGVIRIISARKSTKNETKQYKEFLSWKKSKILANLLKILMQKRSKNRYHWM